MSNILVTLIELGAYMAAIVVARWLLGLSTPKQDWLWLNTQLPTLPPLAYYRWPEYAHQLRGQHIIDMVLL